MHSSGPGIPIFQSTQGTRAEVSSFSLFFFFFFFSVLWPGCIFEPGGVCPMSGRHQPLHCCFVQEIGRPSEINDLRLLPASVTVVVRKAFVAAPSLQNNNNFKKRKKKRASIHPAWAPVPQGGGQIRCPPAVLPPAGGSSPASPAHAFSVRSGSEEVIHVCVRACVCTQTHTHVYET